MFGGCWNLNRTAALALILSVLVSHNSGSPQSQGARPCKTPCALRTSCANCTSQAMECMWCGSTQGCVDSSAYVISFPYGQCLEWQTQDCSGEALSYPFTVSAFEISLVSAFRCISHTTRAAGFFNYMQKW